MKLPKAASYDVFAQSWFFYPDSHVLLRASVN